MRAIQARQVELLATLIEVTDVFVYSRVETVVNTVTGVKARTHGAGRTRGSTRNKEETRSRMACAHAQCIHLERLGDGRDSRVADFVALKVHARERVIDLRASEKRTKWRGVTGGETDENGGESAQGSLPNNGKQV